jgi:acyl-CoA synthetase (AMP-forming)/AMP-acid ligase II
MLAEPSTIGALLAHLAHTIAEQEAVVWPPQRLTYGALYAQATAMAGGLWGLGIRPGEPVALLVSNRPEWLTTALGCALIGAPVVALSTWSRRVKLEYALDHSQAVALVTLDRFLGADYQVMLGEIIPDVTRRPPGQIDAARLPALRELIVHPDTRAVLPPVEVGEILVAGRVTPGYYRDPESNARAFDAEGSFLTADLAMLDAAGRLHFRGRLQRSKGSHTTQVRTVFGTISVKSPRLYQCPCQPHPTETYSPLAALLPEHLTPELLFLETKWAALVSYGITAQLLQDVLPIDDTLARWPPAPFGSMSSKSLNG